MSDAIGRPDPNPSDQRLKVFVSYARADLEFADQLVAALDAYGFATSVDRQSISGGEEWRRRLAELILAADTVVFVLSPASASSDVCAWEISETERLGKRLLPVVTRSLGTVRIPERLKELNHIFFYADPSAPGSGFGAGLATLVKALRVDVTWIREHTRIGELSARWDERGRPDELLVRGSELADVLAWRTRRPHDAPDLTALQRDFVNISEDAERARKDEERRRLDELSSAVRARELTARALVRRTVLGGGTVVALAGATTGISYWGWQQADALERERERNKRETREREAARTDIKGQLTGYAAGPGRAALDVGPGSNNSPYTHALVLALRNRNTSVFDALAHSNQSVLNATKGKQRPFLSSDLNGDIFLWRKPNSRRQVVLVVSIDSVGSIVRPLRTPMRDAAEWMTLFRAANVPAHHIHNPDRASFLEAMDHVVRALKLLERGTSDRRAESGLFQRAGLVSVERDPEFDNTVFWFVYTGYGMAINNVPLIPLPASAWSDGKTKLADATRNPDLALSVVDVQDRLSGIADASVVILDTGFPEQAR